MKEIKNINIIFIIALIFSSCVEEPSKPDDRQTINSSKTGALILCEGPLGMDMATISRFDIKENSIQNDFFGHANPGMFLGDVANDIVLMGDTAFISVSMSHTVERFRVSDGKSLGRIYFGTSVIPRKICIYNQSRAFVSSLSTASVIEFNPQTLEIIKDNISVGPYPEGLAVHGNYLFVANSGLGDYHYDAPGAGSVSVIDLNTYAEVKRLEGMPNVTELLVEPVKKQLFAAYRHLHSLEDSLAGIVQFDINTLNPVNHWRDSILNISLSPGGDSLVYISNDEIKYINLRQNPPKPATLAVNPKPEEIWHSAAINPADNTLWIGNARNYQVNGELLIYYISNQEFLKNRYEIGIIPNKILFY